MADMSEMIVSTLLLRGDGVSLESVKITIII